MLLLHVYAYIDSEISITFLFLLVSQKFWKQVRVPIVLAEAGVTLFT